MPIIDSQVHAYEKNHPGRPWTDVLPGPDEITGDQMVAAMDAVGVDGAILVSPYATYRHDASYAINTYFAHPTKFRIVKPVDPNDPKVGDGIAEWAGIKGTCGVRIMFRDGVSTDPADPGINRVLTAAAKHGLALNCMITGRLEQAGQLAARNPNTQMVIDHLGIQQPRVPPAAPQPWADLPKLLALAQYPNIAVKISGACTLAHEPFPYNDIWDPLAKIFDAFGFDRCLWGTDWTRASPVLNYKQGVDPFVMTDRLSASDRAKLMGESTMKVYNWNKY
jgi:L-fuconolactonase